MRSEGIQVRGKFSFFPSLLNGVAIALENPNTDKDLLRALLRSLEEAIKSNDPVKAATATFQLALEISDACGKEQARDILERCDAMAIEIDSVLEEIASSGFKEKPGLVWQKLVERCGRPGSCCAEHVTDSERGQAVIIWFGTQGNREKLTMKALRERLRRRKKRQNYFPALGIPR